jgi:transcription elongation factor Elf1
MMAKLTARQRQRYLDSRGSRCPFCESDNITAASNEADADYITQEVACDDCGEEWMDLFTLADVLNADGSEAATDDLSAAFTDAVRADRGPSLNDLIEEGDDELSA